MSLHGDNPDSPDHQRTLAFGREKGQHTGRRFQPPVNAHPVQAPGGRTNHARTSALRAGLLIRINRGLKPPATCRASSGRRFRPPMRPVPPGATACRAGQAVSEVFTGHPTPPLAPPVPSPSRQPTTRSVRRTWGSIHRSPCSVHRRNGSCRNVRASCQRCADTVRDSADTMRARADTSARCPGTVR